MSLSLIWNTLFVEPIFNLLMGFYYLIPNLGVAIILLTLAVRFITLPMTLKQLKMGIKVEKEHTSNDKIAREIALDHLGELPDYYTRLKKMEK